MDVVFLEPCFPQNQREFVRALHAVGARVTGIGERPKSSLDPDLQRWLTHYEQVGNVTNEAEVEKVVRWLQGRVRVERLEAVIEAHVMTAAKVRERCGIEGTSVKTTFLCRDKPSMKEALVRAGVPCAQSIGSGDPAEIRDFAKRIGMLKPLRDGPPLVALHAKRRGDDEVLPVAPEQSLHRDTGQGKEEVVVDLPSDRLEVECFRTSHVVSFPFSPHF